MPISIAAFEKHNEEMIIPGEDRLFLSKASFRNACNQLCKSNKLNTVWPAQDYLEIIIATLIDKAGEPPKDVGTPGHKYEQTPAQRASFKHVCKTGRTLKDGSVLNKNRKVIVPREEAYNLICKAHILLEGTLDEHHLSRDETWKNLQSSFPDFDVTSKANMGLFLATCTHPTCRKNHEAGAERADKRKMAAQEAGDDNEGNQRAAKKPRINQPLPVKPFLPSPPRNAQQIYQPAPLSPHGPFIPSPAPSGLYWPAGYPIPAPAPAADLEAMQKQVNPDYLQLFDQVDARNQHWQ